MVRVRGKRGGVSGAVFRARHDYLPGTEVFRAIDLDVASDTLSLEERGEADGKSGIPGPVDGSLTVTERAIIGYVQRRWEETVYDAKRVYDGLRGRHAAYSIETEIDILLAEPRAAALRLREVAREEADRLHFAFQRIISARRALQEFKDRENIAREPIHGQTAEQKLFLLSLAVLAEFVINIGIFGMADAQGFAGAAPKVLVIPILNIGVGWALSYGLARRIQMRSPWQKLVGLAGCGAALVWVLWLNLVVAHWRDAFGSELDMDAGVAAMQAIVEHPLHLVSVTSWALFFIGLAAGMIACVEGWWWDDPYPGHGALRRRSENAFREFTDLRVAAISRLQSEADSTSNHLGDAQRTAERAIADRPHIAALAASLVEDLSLYEKHLERITGDLFSRYREANVRARGGDRPAWFDSEPEVEFAAPQLPALPIDRDVRKVAGKLASALVEITEAHDAACQKIPSLSELEAAA